MCVFEATTGGNTSGWNNFHDLPKRNRNRTAEARIARPRSLGEIGVGGGLLFFLLLRNGGRVFVRNLALDPHEVGDVAAGIAEGGNEELIPEGCTIDAVVEQADGHVVAGFDRLADALGCLGIRFWTLQEATIAAEDLIQRVAGEVEKSLTGIDDRVVGQRGVRDHEVLLGRLEGLDEGEVRVIEDLVGEALRLGKETTGLSGGLAPLVKQLGGSLIAQVGADGAPQLLVFLLEEGDGLLKRLEEELLANARALGVLAVAFALRGKGTTTRKNWVSDGSKQKPDSDRIQSMII